ncbi:hypothetical protein BDZ31_001936 [Conexibacter arvalis]|uniref:Uncharacterized protein n=1 Tax=Conexibacter arvalis TaxID=912552 RepID=A0A840IEJ0_9ACTN|nr:hypothetical protein [Conexibacter arvalis]
MRGGGLMRAIFAIYVAMIFGGLAYFIAIGLLAR